MQRHDSTLPQIKGVVILAHTARVRSRPVSAGTSPFFTGHPRRAAGSRSSSGKPNFPGWVSLGKFEDTIYPRLRGLGSDRARTSDF